MAALKRTFVGTLPSVREHVLLQGGVLGESFPALDERAIIINDSRLGIVPYKGLLDLVPLIMLPCTKALHVCDAW